MDRTKLIADNLHLVDVIAQQLHKRSLHKYSIGHELEDLIAAGRVGLIEAVDRYDPNLNVKPATYFGWRIKGRIKDYLRSQNWLSRSDVAARAKVLKAKEHLRRALVREPTLQEIQLELGVDDEAFQDFARVVAGLVWHFGGEASDDTDSLAGISDDRLNPRESAQRAEIAIRLKQVVYLLNGNERTVIEMYYFDYIPMREIGAKLGVSESRVSQIHNKAIKRLRSMVKRDVFAPAQ